MSRDGYSSKQQSTASFHSFSPVTALVSIFFVFAGCRLRFIAFRRSPASFHSFSYLPVAGFVSFLFAGHRPRFVLFRICSAGPVSFLFAGRRPRFIIFRICRSPYVCMRCVYACMYAKQCNAMRACMQWGGNPIAARDSTCCGSLQRETPQLGYWVRVIILI